MKCKHCNQPINPRRAELGYGTCIKCSRTQRYIGRRNGKHGDIEIFRTNQEYFRRQLRRENRVCYNANLPFNSPNDPFINKNDMEKSWLQKINLKEASEGDV